MIGVPSVSGQADRAGVVDQRIDAAELLHRLLDRRFDRSLLANIHLQRQRFAAERFHFRGDAVDRAFQLRMRLRGLRRDHDVGAVRAQRNAIALPMPRLAPVMKMVLFFSVRI